MYTSNELEALSMSFDSQMKRLQDEVMSDIIRRLEINGEITRAADWQINRLYELGMTKDDIEKSIQKSLSLSEEKMTELYKEALESGYARNEGIYKKVGAEFIPFEENALLQQYIAAVAKQSTEEMHNISQSLGFAVKNADGTLSFKPIAQYYQDTLDNAINGIASGVFDYNTALKKAVKEITNSGLRTVDYASGWSNRVDVAARRAVMTGMSQLTGKVNEMNAEKLETDTYEVTWHSGARPSHQVWQGKWYTMDELISVCGLGTVTGLNGANCYHDYYPVIPGISVPTYTAEELEELNRKENTPVKYEGKEYTKYEALQRQRRLETTMRAQRQKIKLLQVGKADEDDIIAARCRYRGTSQEYTRFSKAMDLPQQRERVTVDGLGNIGQGKWKKPIDELYRKKDYTHRKTSENGRKIIDKPTYNKLTKEFIENGGIIIRGEEAAKHLGFAHSASYLPSLNAAFIRDDATVSDVIEEMYHAKQDRIRMFGDKLTDKVLLKREIDAQKYLLSLTKRYKIPLEEVEETKKNLLYYENELKKMLKEGEE